jgi:tetratricopeptide (TPR) repeat protein
MAGKKRSAARKRQPAAKDAGRSAAVSPGPGPASDRAPAFRSRLLTGALLAVTLLAFSPVLRADFVTWDDPNYVVNNSLLDDGAGLREIWDPSSPRLTQGGLQYYPLVFSSFWLERRIFGKDARGHHAVNLALHLANAGLAFLLARSLGLAPAVALFAAGVFALHPTQVASVAWVSERKNVLCGLFCLLAFLLYLRHRRSGQWGAYVASLAAFAAALLSKSQAATLPVALFLCEWLVLAAARGVRRIPLDAVAWRLAPMFLMALVSAATTHGIEAQVIGDYYEIPALAERPFVAAGAAWFYVGKFLLPLRLSPLYPRWTVDPASPWWWMGPLAWVAALGALLRWWRSIGPLCLWGMALFLIWVAPALGLLRFAYQHRSLVADHFLYLSCLGGGIALGALGERLAGRSRAVRQAVLGAGLVLLAAYATAAHLESRHWRDSFAFWSHVATLNPDAYPPNINLGEQYRSRGQIEKATRFYRRAVEIRPANVYALGRYLDAVREAGGHEAVVRVCGELLAANTPIAPRVYFLRAQAHAALGRSAEALADYDRVLARTRRGSPLWRDATKRKGELAGR